MLEKILRYAALAGIFALPFIVLIVARSLFFPFITGKNFTFRILVELIAGAWLVLALVYPRYRPKRSWILLCFALFVVVIGFSDVTGVSPAKSLWSNYERMEGWVTLVHLFVYFAAAVSLLTPHLWKRWFQVSLGVSALIACFGFMQLAGLATINQGGVRLDATLGNATYLAVYMLFHVFIAALLFINSWGARERGKPLWPLLLYGGSIVLNTIILFFTATRGAMLGLLGGILLAGLLYVVQERHGTLARVVGVGVVALVILSCGLWFARESAFVQSSGSLSRLTSLSINEGTVAARFTNWSMAWQGVKERPLFGWGQENFAVVFDKHYDPRMYAQEPWFDRVHQVVLDWLVAGGIVGLLAYLSLYVTTLWMLWRTPVFSPGERSLITGLLAGYFFYLLFTFDNIMSYLLFISILAYVTVRATEGGQPLFSDSAAKPRYLPGIAAGALVLVGVTFWMVNQKPITANQTLIRALMPQQAGLTKNLEYFKEALALDTFGTQEVREHLSQTAARIAAGEGGVPLELKQQFVQLAATEMAKQIEETPQNARFPFFLGILLNTAGAFPDARVALEKALSLSPRKPQIMFEVGLNAMARGDNAEALRILERAHTLAPDSFEGNLYYALAAARAGDRALVMTLIPKVAEGNRALDSRLLTALAQKEYYDAIAELGRSVSLKNPQQHQAYMAHAVGLYMMGRRDEALRVLEEGKKNVSDVSQINAILAEMQAGTFKIQ